MIVCAWCGEPFERPSAQGPTPRYCRPSHRQRAYQDRREAAFRDRIAELERALAASSRSSNPGRRDA